MKKLLYSLLAVGTVAGLASCSSDEPMMSGNNDGKVTIEVKLPDFGTRFYGDQLQCNELIYTVFDASGNAIEGVTDVTQGAFGNGVTSETVTLNLVPGETYMVAFYAHNNGSLFSTYSNGTIDVNYEKMNVNSEIDDAFYCYKEISTTATEPQSVTLNRAFAQINFGTNDFDNALVKNVIGSLEATLTINGGLSTSLDAKTNAVSVPQSEAVTVSNTLTSNEDFPVSGYGNLTSVYVLVGGEEGEMLSTGSYVVMNGTKEVRNVNLASTPVRMNYRTNIYGSMLTTQIPVTVEIEPNFGETAYDISIAKSVEELKTLLEDDTNRSIFIPEEFDITPLTSQGNVMITSNKEIINNGKIINNSSNGYLRVQGEGVEVNFIGGEYETTENSLFMIVARDGATVNISNAKMTGLKKTDGTLVGAMGGTVNLSNTTVETNYCAVQAWDGVENSIVNAQNCTFISHSSTLWGSYPTYAVNIYGDTNKMVLKDCTVLGVQGAIGAGLGGQIDIYDTTAGTFLPEGETKFITFYPVYSAGNAVVNIYSGFFYTENKANINVCEHGGTINMMGGYYNQQPSIYPSTALEPANGYKFVDVTETQSIPTPWGTTKEVTYTRQVVAE